MYHGFYQGTELEDSKIHNSNQPKNPNNQTQKHQLFIKTKSNKITQNPYLIKITRYTHLKKTPLHTFNKT